METGKLLSIFRKLVVGKEFLVRPVKLISTLGFHDSSRCFLIRYRGLKLHLHRLELVVWWRLFI